MHFMEYRVPAALEQIRRILAIPFKKTESRLVRHLTVAEMQALLNAPDPTTRAGIRDRALLHVCYAAGLRVSELIGIRLDDLTLQPQAALLVRGKGRRERCLPLWKTTTAALRGWLAVRGPAQVPELFLNVRGAPFTRSGVEYILRKHAKAAKPHCPSLATKRVYPHLVRHTSALTVLQATKDLRKVSLWLGHAHMQTTEIYTRADPSVKLEALESMMPPKLRSGRFKASDKLIASLTSRAVMRSEIPSR
jgi:site-specific recombinase XerD